MTYTNTPQPQKFLNNLSGQAEQYQRSLKHCCLILLLSCISLTSLAASHLPSKSSASNTLVCTLYQEAIQAEVGEHSSYLSCQTDTGLTYQIQGPLAAIDIQYKAAVQALDNSLVNGIVALTGINTNQSVKLNLAKAKLAQQLGHLAHPKLTVNRYQISSDTIFINENTNWQVDLDKASLESQLNAYTVAAMSRMLAVTEGINERTALVIHVTANDASTEASPTALGDSVFGTLGDSVNMTSQYSACSYDTLNFMPAQGTDISNGVVELTINMNVAGESRGTIVNAVTDAGNALFGSLYAQADHVMFALPPGTSGGWIAYASVGGKRSVYNNNWATYVSGQMHEVGHNLGMGHSGVGGDEYADTSGMMGYSYSSDDGPVMCFNSAKSSKFGWYSDKEVTLYENDFSLENNAWTGKVIGLSDYGNVASDQNILVKIHSENDNVNSPSLNINFNRDAGINNGTRSGKDQLNVVSTAFPTGYNTTLREVTLNSGESETFINHWMTGTDLTITVNDIDTDTNGVMYADVEISVEYNLDDLIYADGFD